MKGFEGSNECESSNKLLANDSNDKSQFLPLCIHTEKNPAKENGQPNHIIVQLQPWAGGA